MSVTLRLSDKDAEMVAECVEQMALKKESLPPLLVRIVDKWNAPAMIRVAGAFTTAVNANKPTRR